MPKRSYKAVFFDLDGTLLPIDMDAFLKNYFNDIAAFVQACGHDPKQFIDALSAGVKSMLTKQGGLNSERFWETFTSRMGGDSSAEYEKMLDEYYATYFDGHHRRRTYEGHLPRQPDRRRDALPGGRCSTAQSANRSPSTFEGECPSP